MQNQTRLLPVLTFLQYQLAGTLQEGDRTYMQYPTAIATLLGIRLAAIEKGCATLELDVDPTLHGNQQGTIHGGLISELADAAIGTAHSTEIAENESFTSMDLKVNFIRPVWKSTLRACARVTHQGKTVSHYHCDIFRDDGKVVATAVSMVMTLRGDQAIGR